MSVDIGWVGVALGILMTELTVSIVGFVLSVVDCCSKPVMGGEMISTCKQQCNWNKYRENSNINSPKKFIEI